MTRLPAVLLVSVLLAAAGPRLPAASSVPLPLPPPPPANPPTDRAAPVPDSNVAAPYAGGPSTFTLRLYPMQDFQTGEGFIPGSEYQSPELRKPMQPPGFIFTVPLK